MTKRRGRILVLSTLLVTAATATGSSVDAGGGKPEIDLEFVGQQIIPTGTTFEGTQIGGLSSLAYDADRDRFYVLSDDPSQFNPARFYTVQLDASDGRLDDGDIDVVAVTTLLNPQGVPFATASLDPEGLALTGDDELVVTTEGFANRDVDPFIDRFALDGTHLDSLTVPAPFLPDPGQTRGVRLNLGFESAATIGHFLYTGAENAVVQDGPAASLAAGSPSRLVRYNLKSGRPDRQHLYWSDPIAEPPVPAGNFAVNGLVEVLPLNNQYLLSMERSFSVGAPDTGNTIKLYLVKVAGADNISGLDSVAKKLAKIRPVKKTLLLDLDELGISLDNVEGMAFGPDLPDGRRSLLLVSDNNFSPAQFTQFLLFAVTI
jgi:hypothetical protein